MRNEYNNFFALMRARAQHQPDRLIYRFVDKNLESVCALSYAELDYQARNVAAKLQRNGLQGERVLLLFKQDVYFIIAFFACVYAGVIAVPVELPRNKNKVLDKLRSIFENAQINTVLSTSEILSGYGDNLKVGHVAQHAEHLAIDELAFDWAPSWVEPEIDEKTIIFLQYTSASTGAPKGVIVTHENLLNNVALIKEKLGNTHESVGFGWLPFYHDMGLIGNVLYPIYANFPFTYMSPTNFIQKPQRWLEGISRYRATLSGAPNFAYELCVETIAQEALMELDLSCWEIAFNGAEPVQLETLNQFADKFSVCQFKRKAIYPLYGMAESTLMISGGVRFSPYTVFPGGTLVSVGSTTDNHQVLVVNERNHCQCPEGTEGEIWFKGPSVALGYWNNSSKTQECFDAICRSNGERGYLRTGDLGIMKDGELYVTGRIKDVLIINGKNHYPQDIERVAQQSNPALVMGGGAAFMCTQTNKNDIVLVQEVQRTALKTVNYADVYCDIRNAVFSELGISLSAIALIFPSTVQRTSSGKIQRFKNKELYLNQNLRVLAIWQKECE